MQHLSEQNVGLNYSNVQVPWFAGVPHPFEWDMISDSETRDTLVELGHKVML